MLNRWIGSAMASLALLGSAGAHAARDFTPQAGTWVVSEELNGKPGRGLVIDVQGNTFFMQVFGYEKNGDATFYTATGQMDGNGVTAPLMRYQGGRSFGGGARDAVEDKSLGDVTVSFSNGLKGTVQFPGEPAADIERFLYNDPVFDDGVLRRLSGRSMQWFVTGEDGRPQAWSALLHKKPDGRLALRVQSMNYVCQRDAGVQTFSCDRTADTSAEAPSAGDFPRLRFMTAAGAVAGWVESSTLVGARLPVTGWVRASGVSTVAQVCASADFAYFFSSQCLSQPMGSNGTWVFADELTGKPGRGVSVDAQEGVLILQVFNYLADGRPTFHMGSGSYGPYDTSFNPLTLEQRGVVTLARYAGGRYLGGAAQSATVVEGASDAGTALFVLGLGAREQPNSFFSEASLQLPYEPAKKLQRLRFDSGEPLAILRGDWYFRFQDTTGGGVELPKFFTLNQEIGSTVVSSDGRVACGLHPVNPKFYECLLYENASRERKLSEITFLYNGFGFMDRAIQLRDHLGNARGVGAMEDPVEP